MATVDKQYSNFWLDQELFEDDDDTQGADEKGLDLNRVARLAAIRRAIGNFVSILSGKNVPVEFSSGKDSYTTGDRVVISADDDPTKFDVMVGLALHEGSHVLLSDFSFLRAIDDSVRQMVARKNQPRTWGTPSNSIPLSPTEDVLNTIIHPALSKVLGPCPNGALMYSSTEEYYGHEYWVKAIQMLDDLQFLMNVLEDRRIDQYVYRNAGGYRPYYLALYNRYFFTGEAGKNLRFNPKWREVTVENYLNRILYSFHPAAKADALPGLEAIYKRLDLPNISRVAPENDPAFVELNLLTGEPTGEKYPLWWKECSYKATPVLWKEANIIYAHILRFVQLGNVEGKGPTIQVAPPKGVAQPSPNADLPNLDISSGPQVTMEPVAGEGSGQDTEDESLEDIGGPSTPEEMQATPVEKDKKGKGKKEQEVEGKFNEKKAQKELKDAKAVMSGEMKRKKITKEENAAVKAIESAEGELVDIKGEGVPFGRAMVTRKVTKELLEQDWFIFKSWTYNGRADQHTENAIAAGRRMGQIMHHRLQVRNDPMVTKQTRLPQGGLDRRLLANLGMDITSVFQKSRTDIHKPAMLHLTLDASGSMSGRKWHKVVTVAVALAYVGSKMQNVDTVISIRGGNNLPIVSVIFDSRREQFNRFMTTIRQIRPNGATPEGLAFKATMDLILENADTHDVYFINFSDGEPAFDMTDNGGLATRGRRNRWGRVHGRAGGAWFGYGGEQAAKHTRAQVKEMRDRGVKVLSYFIEDNGGYNYRPANYESNARILFRKMYGEDAVFVNVESAGEVIRTLNSRLITRG